MDAASLKKADNRPVYEYEFPEELMAELNDKHIKKSIGLIKLKMSEEIAASANAGVNQTKLAYSFLRSSLVEVDGRRIDKSVGEDETILENCDAVLRTMMLDAYTDVCGATAGATKKFLASRKVKVG